MATIGQALPSPEAGWKRYEANSGAVSYVGSWNDNSGNDMITSVAGDKAYFNFIGTELRMLSFTSSNRSDMTISIDGGTPVTYSNYRSSGSIRNALTYEITGLTDQLHTIEITNLNTASSGTGQFGTIDAVDIDDSGRLFHPDEVLIIDDLIVGKRIRCHYSSLTSGTIGSFSGIFEETSDFLPMSSSDTPDGDFYLIMVKDWNGQKKMVSDRNIQNSTSWDTLNNAGIASGSGIKINLDPKLRTYVRLLTGGFSSSDTTNEWNEYIVNSDLNGAITPGDRNVWNYNFTWSLTSTTLGSDATKRILRGSTVSGWSSDLTGAVTNTRTGFRPLFLIDIRPSLFTFLYYDIGYNKWDGTQWLTISNTIPDSEVFINDGMDNIAILDRSSKIISQNMSDVGSLGSGKVFKSTIDFSSFIDLTNITIE